MSSADWETFLTESTMEAAAEGAGAAAAVGVVSGDAAPVSNFPVLPQPPSAPVSFVSAPSPSMAVRLANAVLQHASLCDRSVGMALER